MDATIRALFIKPQKGARTTPLDAADAIVGGFAGDHHTGSSKRRQVLVVSGSVLDEFDLSPGAISENVVIDGIDVMSLKEGQQFLMGDALVEVTVPCEPCIQMERLRRGLREALQDRRGIFVRVLKPGRVRVGDPLLFL